MPHRCLRPLTETLPLAACLAVLLGASLGPWASPAAATTFVRVSDENLVDQSPAIAVVEVLAADDAVGVSGRVAPSTEYTVRVVRLLKGEAAGSTLVVRVPGGRGPEGKSLWIADAPSFQPGERALLFLEPASAGAFRLRHFLQGAFHEVGAGAKSLAARRLAGALEMKVTPSGGLDPVEGAPGDAPRDFAAFADWIEKRAGGERPAADYFLDPLDPATRALVDKFVLFADDDDGRHIRWFTFDSGGTVSWRTHSTGQAGLADGGVSEATNAMAVWNADGSTPISYTRVGTTSATGGLRTSDGVNAILWNDPTDQIDPFVCGSGGTLAIGGPWYQSATPSYQGIPYHSSVEADIVVNNGLECYFGAANGVTNATSTLAHELGHTLGIDHSPISSALMYFSIQNNRGPALGADDIAAIACVYAGIGTGCGSGTPTPPAGPSALVATPFSSTQIQLNWSDNANNETGYQVQLKPAGGSYTVLTTLSANATSTVAGGLSPATAYTFRVRAAGSNGTFSAFSNEATATTQAGGGGSCTPSATALCLNGGRFRVSVTWRRSNGQTGVGTIVPALTTADSGVFWFFGATNWEMLVKVLNGCGVNNRHWVFFGALTDQQFTLTVTDTQKQQTKTYTSVQGVVSPVITDTNAFATCP